MLFFSTQKYDLELSIAYPACYPYASLRKEISSKLQLNGKAKEMVRESIDRLKDRIDELESENEALQDENESLQDRLDSIVDIASEEEEEDEESEEEN